MQIPGFDPTAVESESLGLGSQNFHYMEATDIAITTLGTRTLTKCCLLGCVLEGGCAVCWKVFFSLSVQG